MTTPELLWTPSAERVQRATLTRYIAWLGRTHGLELSGYDELWRWSVSDLEGFWDSIAKFSDVRFEQPATGVLGSREMPGAEWFPGARLSYAEHIFRGKVDDRIAVQFASELRELDEWSWGTLRAQTAAIADGLKRLGVPAGGRGGGELP